VDGAKISVTYWRPYGKGRKIFGSVTLEVPRRRRGARPLVDRQAPSEAD